MSIKHMHLLGIDFYKWHLALFTQGTTLILSRINGQ